MADELKIRATVTLENGNYKDTFNPGLLEVDQAAAGRGGHVQSIGTSAETVEVGDVSTLGWCVLRNCDATNYVTIGPDDSGIKNFMRLEAGEFAIFRLEPGITIKAIANTAAVLLDVRVYED